MKVGQATFWCGTVFGLTLGLAAGHATLWRSDADAPPDFATFASATPSAMGQSRPFGMSGPSSAGIGPVPTPADIGLPSVVNNGFGHTEFGVTIQTADVGSQRSIMQAEVASTEPVANVEPPETAEPSALQPAPNASPIDCSTASRDEVTRRVITSELPKATPQEQDAWFDALSGMPAEDVRNILRIRKKIGDSAPPVIGLHSPFNVTRSAPTQPAKSRQSESPPAASPSTDEPSDRFTDRSSETDHTMLPALHSARQILLSNIANASTVGFKRVEPMYADRTAQEASRVHLGLNLVGSRTDFQQGELDRSSSPLDLAIDGAGFFAVEIGKERLYTRDGRFALDDQHRLVLAATHGAALLQPTLVVDADIEQIIIDSDGRVTGIPAAGTDEADTRELGRLTLTLFVNPAGLLRAGNGLFRPTAKAGQPHDAAPLTGKRGSIEQYHREAANVDFDREMQGLGRIEELIDLITGG